MRTSLTRLVSWPYVRRHVLRTMLTVAGIVPVILAAAFIAALWPAESAVRASLVEALEYE